MGSPDLPKMPMLESSEISSKIQKASSIEELIQILESTPQIKGGQRPYTGVEVAERVRLYINKERGIDIITSSNGIRERVLELSGNKPK